MMIVSKLIHSDCVGKLIQPMSEKAAKHHFKGFCTYRLKQPQTNFLASQLSSVYFSDDFCKMNQSS